jgi:heme-binding protein
MTPKRKLSETTVRRGLYGMLAGGLLGGVTTAAFALPSAEAAPDPCTASGVATAQSTVQEQMSTYLQGHPATDQALTDIAKQAPTQAAAAYAAYFNQNPTVVSDLKGLQRPVTELTAQCGIQASSSDLTDALKLA